MQLNETPDANPSMWMTGGMTTCCMRSMVTVRRQILMNNAMWSDDLELQSTVSAYDAMIERRW